MMRSLLAFSSLLLFAASCRAETIVIGEGSGAKVGWMDGVCYPPVKKVWVGDVLQFDFFGHNLYKMASRQHFDNCDFSDALLLAGMGSMNYEYKVTSADVAEGTLYFGCSVGGHCSASGTQKIQIELEPNQVQAMEDIKEGNRKPKSYSLFQKSVAECDEIQNGKPFEKTTKAHDSECDEPVLGDDGYYHTTCLSPRVTLTPGGVINSMHVVHYPFPRNERVLLGLRTWEFVMDDPNGGPVIPVPARQLYIHHITGTVILGQGNEGMRRKKVDAPFPHPYGIVSGDDDEFMVFHLIDLREVGDDWLACIECRCANGTSTYPDELSGGSAELGITAQDGTLTTGGITCCTNCTDLTGPTIDYRLRYNVSYAHIEPEDEPVKLLDMLFADIALEIGRFIEWDVPKWDAGLAAELRKESDPTVQRIVRELPFTEMFDGAVYGFPAYDWPETIRLFRCIGHLHVAALGMWLEDAETGEMLCSGTPTYGTDPDDYDLLTAIHVDDYEEPLEFPSDRMVRFITEYNASEVHTGVMGIYLLFIDAERELTAAETDLKVDVCHNPVCNIDMLPQHTSEELLSLATACEDTLEDHVACTAAGFCDCSELIAGAPVPEEERCDYTYEDGGLLVKSVCAKSCGCPIETCDDLLPSTFMCTRDEICDCKTLVDHELSTGCDGEFASSTGAKVQVNDVCASYCDACPASTEEELIAQQFATKLEEQLEEKCKYATDECREHLNNAYSCSLEMPGLEAHEQVIRRATVAHGGRLARKFSMIGSPSLHRDEMMMTGGGGEGVEILSCDELAARTSAATTTTAHGWFTYHALTLIAAVALSLVNAVGN